VPHNKEGSYLFDQTNLKSVRHDVQLPPRGSCTSARLVLRSAHVRM
jgi:hypothetical protein